MREARYRSGGRALKRAPFSITAIISRLFHSRLFQSLPLGSLLLQFLRFFLFFRRFNSDLLFGFLGVLTLAHDVLRGLTFHYCPSCPYLARKNASLRDPV